MEREDYILNIIEHHCQVKCPLYHIKACLEQACPLYEIEKVLTDLNDDYMNSFEFEEDFTLDTYPNPLTREELIEELNKNVESFNQHKKEIEELLKNENIWENDDNGEPT